MFRLTSLIASVLLLTAVAASAQPRTAFPEKRGFKLSDFPRVVKLADNVYGYEEIRQPGFTTVSMFVVGNDGVLIADGQGSPQATQAMLDHIRKITPKPVKWYVVGSDHGDHTAGNSVLPKDITYIVSPRSKSQMERDAANPNRRADQPPVVVPPTAMSGDRQVIDVGGLQVEALFLGRAHTGGDLMVYVPRDKILFMSEAFLNRVFPAMRSAYPSEWVKQIDRALAMDVTRYVPGHGFVEEPAASREELVEYQKAVKYVIAEATRLHGKGLSAADAAKQADWGPYADWMLADSQAPIAVQKVWDEIDGTLPK
ncbi:MAG: MBL fold metallo-hydrolase [Vicinamibacterales bacterium]